MNVEFDNQKNFFHVYSDKISLILGITKEGCLVQKYFGKKIKEYHESNRYEYLDRAFSPSPYSNDRTFSLDTQRLVYSCTGLGDFRTPAFEVVNEHDALADLRYHRHKIYSGKKELTNLPSSRSNENECMTLEIELVDSFLEMNIHLFFTIFDDSNVIATHAEFVNGMKQHLFLNKALSFMIDLPSSNYDLIKLTGSYAREKMVQRSKLQQGLSIVNSRRGASGHGSTPFIALTEPNANENYGEIISLQLIYSGDFEAGAFVDQLQNTRLFIGINHETFGWQLNKGETFITPEALLAYHDHGLGQMSRELHDFVERYILRGRYKQKERPILLNNWEATYFDFNEEKLLKLADHAEKVGIELFVLDDGWFGKRMDDNSSLGDWTVNYDKLEIGLSGLAKKINDRGMQFGLWVEPEMISVDSELYRDHPDWCIQATGREHTFSRNQLVLDLSQQAVCDYIIHSMSKVFTSSTIQYVKWDMNRNITNISSLSNAKGGKEVAHRYMLGLYHVLAELTQKFPKILFESCAGGGGRYDLGMLCFMPQTWTSDNTDAICRLDIQFGTSLIFPAITMGAHVSAVPNHQVERSVSLETRGAVAMAGNLGYELDLTKLSEAELKAIKEQITFYKKIRPIIQKGELYRLDCSTNDNNDIAFSYVAKDQSESVVTYIRKLAVAEAPITFIKLKGLDSEATYLELETGRRFCGDELMNVGLTIPYSKGDFSSIVYYFRKL
ncbi:alpha-galactosidase [Enterococcus sp. AZ126]|uniref:alpha-galactosidase n=1 Tax=Enterococcus sp. AZ126 TaxID=2774635 RepID=UPI003F244ED3